GAQFVGENFGRDIGDEDHGDDKGEESFEQTAVGGIRQARDGEQIVVTPDDTLRADGPKADAGEQKHERVMDEDARERQAKKANQLRGRRHKMQAAERISYHRQGRGGVDEPAQIDLTQGDDKSSVDGQEKHEIHFAGAHVFGNLNAVGQEKGLKNLL